MGQHYCQLTSKQKHDILGRGNYASPFFMLNDNDNTKFEPRRISEQNLKKEINAILKNAKNCKECQPDFDIGSELMETLENEDFLEDFESVNFTNKNTQDINKINLVGDVSSHINNLYQKQKQKINNKNVFKMDERKDPREKVEERLENQYELYEEYQDEHVERVQQEIIRDNTNGFWKYEEDETLKELQDYLSGTYRSHYTSQESKTQTLDLIESIGDAEAFCRSNAIKYLSRFGKKNGKSKLDILKAMHYCVLLYHFAGLHKKSTDNYETF